LQYSKAYSGSSVMPFLNSKESTLNTQEAESVIVLVRYAGLVCTALNAFSPKH
jgi:hypothetical protein